MVTKNNESYNLNTEEIGNLTKRLSVRKNKPSPSLKIRTLADVTTQNPIGSKSLENKSKSVASSPQKPKIIHTRIQSNNLRIKLVNLQTASPCIKPVLLNDIYDDLPSDTDEGVLLSERLSHKDIAEGGNIFPLNEVSIKEKLNEEKKLCKDLSNTHKTKCKCESELKALVDKNRDSNARSLNLQERDVFSTTMPLFSPPNTFKRDTHEMSSFYQNINCRISSRKYIMPLPMMIKYSI